MEQLRETLREVLQQELSPIVSRLDSLEGRFEGLEGRIDGIEGRFDGIESQLSAMKVQLDRIEQSQSEDVVAMLQLIDKKITERTDRHEHQISLLNDRLFVVEADVHKLLNR